MLFKTILTVIGSKDGEADLNRAIEFATQLGAHLTVLAVDVATPPVISDYPVDVLWLEQRTAEMKALHAAADKAQATCQVAGIPFDLERYYTEGGLIAEVIFRKALYSDLVLIGEKVRGSSDLLRAIVNGAVFDAQRPLLVLPKNDALPATMKTVLLAWNSRAEAGRATREAIEFLAQADAVHVAVVDPDAAYSENGGEPGADVAAFLDRHGVDVTVHQIASGGRPVQDVLAQYAADLGADLIVMGAYGHSRLRERIFGGVTQSMLENPPVPVLMAR